jgi:hypothetical protein
MAQYGNKHVEGRAGRIRAPSRTGAATHAQPGTQAGGPTGTENMPAVRVPSRGS